MRSLLRTRGGKALASVVMALVMAAGLAACSGSSSADSLANQYKAGTDKGFIAADFAVHEYKPGDQPAKITFSGTLENGSTVHSSDYAGKVMVVNFWWAACAPCRQEAPILKKAAAQFAGQDVAFLGVNTYDQPGTAKSFEKEFGITYPSVIDVDSKSVTSAFAKVVPLSATPSTVILGRDGRPTARIIGPIPDPSILASLIQTAQGDPS